MLPASERVARKYCRRDKRRLRVPERCERHQELCGRDNLCGDNAGPRDRYHQGCHQSRAPAVQVLDKIRQRVFTMVVRTARKRNQCDKPERAYEHEPGGGPAEPGTAIDGANHGRPAKDCRHQAPRHRLGRRALARHEEIRNVLDAFGATDRYYHQENEIDY